MRQCTAVLRLFIAILLISGSFGQISAQPAGKKAFTFEDMMALKRVGGPVISPDGQWVLFSAMDVDLASNKKTTHLYAIPLAGGEAHQLTANAAGETGGRWSPDGNILYFISERDGFRCI